MKENWNIKELIWKKEQINKKDCEIWLLILLLIMYSYLSQLNNQLIKNQLKKETDTIIW